jgi:hypothetical protein
MVDSLFRKHRYALRKPLFVSGNFNKHLGGTTARATIDLSVEELRRLQMWKSILVATFLSTMVVTGIASAIEGSSAQQEWRKLEENLRSNNLVQLRVFMIPYQVQTIVRVRPEDVGSADIAARCNIVLSQNERQELIAAVQRTTIIRELDDSLDVRWALTFLDAKGTKFASLYMSLHGSNAVFSELDGNRASINDVLINWLDNRFVPDNGVNPRSPLLKKCA